MGVIAEKLKAFLFALKDSVAALGEKEVTTPKKIRLSEISDYIDIVNDDPSQKKDTSIDKNKKRTFKESLQLLPSILDKIKASLAGKDVFVSSLKASEVPNRIREIELRKFKIPVIPKYNNQKVTAHSSNGGSIEGIVKDGYIGFKENDITQDEYWIVDQSGNKIGKIENGYSGLNAYTWTELSDGYFTALPSGTKRKIVFTDQKAPDNIRTYDLSNNNDNSIIAWLDTSSSTLYISTQIKGIKIEGNKKKTLLFLNGTMSEINFENFDTSQMTSMFGLFQHCQNLERLDLSSFDTSQVTDMSVMFNDCKVLESINFGDFDTSNVVNMSDMFKECFYLQKLDLRKFETSLVTDMSEMFAQCERLTSINLDGFNTTSVTTMEGMFRGCKALSNLDLSDFKTSNVTEMTAMFTDCTNIKILNLSSFNTHNVESMSNMFYGCSNLQTVDLRNFDLAFSTTHIEQMFYNCLNLKTIYASEWYNYNSSSLNSHNMFNQCSNLPNYSSTNVDIKMAKWSTNGGYFTRPN